MSCISGNNNKQTAILSDVFERREILNKKDISLVKKAFKPEESVIDRIYTCYYDNGNVYMMNSDKGSTAVMTEESEEAYHKILRSALTGKIGKKLFSLKFADRGETSDAQQMLCNVYPHDTEKEDIEILFRAIMDSYQPNGRALIILAKGTMDIPAKSDSDKSDYVYEFMLCCVCRAETVKDGLKYEADEKAFVDTGDDRVVRCPEFGFLFPCFNDGMPDIHEVLYYARKEDEIQTEVITGVLGCGEPFPESEQKASFQAAVSSALGESCTVEALSGVYGAVADYVNESKYEREDNTEVEPASFKRVLKENGIDDDAADSMEDELRKIVENGGTIDASNVTEDISITNEYMSVKVKSAYADRIETRVIDGVEYILLPAAGVDVNGIAARSAR